LSRFLIVIGLVLVGLGLLMKLGLPLGRLPGDIVIHRGNSTFYFPIVTCIVVSVLLSILAAILRR
jgi:Protein of unknown function (DUF2905)